MDKFLPWKIIFYQLYLFQLEEYDEERFLRALFGKGLFPQKSLRRKLVFTAKIKLNFILAILIKFFFALALAYLTLGLFKSEDLFGGILLLIIYLYLTDITFFIFSLQAAWITSPFENYAKKRLINKAKVKLHNFEDLTIIGITGSYGKTTMKEVLKKVLEERFKVVSTKGNFNTPIGVAKTILNDLHKNTELLIVEMGEYKKGDVAEICKIATPHISIITGINEAHLERYGSMENAISTKFEIAEFTQPNATIYLNADDDLIQDNYHKYIPKINNVRFFSSKNNHLSSVKVSMSKFDTAKPGISFSLKIGDENIDNINSNFVSEYIIGYASAACLIANQLGMKASEIKFALNQIHPFEHRLEPKKNANNILVIDDTYNGNSNGIKEGLEILKRFKNRRKIYVTPGLVETGFAAKDIHLEIGHWIAKVADLVILTENSVTPYIRDGLISAGFDEKKIIWFKTSKDTYSQLHKHLKPGDVVLMQNDWSDNYV